MKKKKEIPLKLNLGCGTSKIDGYTNIDISKEVKPDIVHDLSKYPWPFKANSVDEIHCSHFLEHLDGLERIKFFNECDRIMKKGTKIRCITPAPFTHRYMQDPTHKFPMVVQEFYNYLHEASRKAMGLEHYPLICNFEWTGVMHENTEAVGGRNDEFKQFAMRHYINTCMDLDVTLTKL